MFTKMKTITIDSAAAGRMRRTQLLRRVFNLIASERVALAALAALCAASFFCAVAGWPRACAACAGAEAIYSKKGGEA